MNTLRLGVFSRVPQYDFVQKEVLGVIDPGSNHGGAPMNASEPSRFWPARAALVIVLGMVAFVTTPSFADTQMRVVSQVYPTYVASTPSTALVQSETLQPGDPNWALTTSFTYDSNGNRTGTSVVGPAYITTAIATASTYDPSGRFPASSTDAVGHTTSFTYGPALGLIASQTDPNNLTTTWSYGAWGRKTLAVRPDGTRTAYAHKLCGALASGTTEPSRTLSQVRRGGLGHHLSPRG